MIEEWEVEPLGPNLSTMWWMLMYIGILAHELYQHPQNQLNQTRSSQYDRLTWCSFSFFCGFNCSKCGFCWIWLVVGWGFSLQGAFCISIHRVVIQLENFLYIVCSVYYFKQFSCTESTTSHYCGWNVMAISKLENLSVSGSRRHFMTRFWQYLIA